MKFITGIGAVCGLVSLGGCIELVGNGQIEYWWLILINCTFVPINIWGFIHSIKHNT